MGNWMIKAAVCSDKGSLRKNNEDAWFFNGRHVHLSEMSETAFLTTETDAQGSLWAICDGMGGQSNGEKASHTAVSGLKGLQAHLAGREFNKTVQEWVHQANKAVNSRAEGGSTTLVMLYCSDGEIYTAHVGDSRIYRYHKGQLTRITKDHSRVEMLLDLKMITPEEAANHPQKHIITRYLGMDPEFVCDATIGGRIAYRGGDRYLLCSDGITDMLTDEQIAGLMAENRDVEDCVREIHSAVYAAGAMDNLTVILLELVQPDYNT